MARFRITVTHVIEMEQEVLQEAALELPSVMAGIRLDGEMSLALASVPGYAGQALGGEMHNQMLMLLRNREFVVPGGMPEIKVEPVCELDGAA
ncbi:hypothetical protein [Arthrobacter sp. ISL-95]|uniref:hypothetical protein n=1 Tax=Arthrobacter sp. ISL-95 TaxID=2819116 RepID=UPI001BE669BA|nr:hypothetical protein [Arthrobacter sp. ISL-95]MBT2588409.1 hypothetical protein [Arthrobacter sp. ISL-95]